MAAFISQAHPTHNSDTTRARQRTAWLAPLQPEVLRHALAYLAIHPSGTQVTLAVLAGLGEPRLTTHARSAGRSFDTIKKDIGLYTVLVLIDHFGRRRVETLRNPATGKNSTRSRTADWPTLPWVSRYTPHRVVARVRSPLSDESLPEDLGGFRAVPYLDVNREERFYCSLLAHALLAHRTARVAFCSRVADVVPGCSLDPDALEIFPEAAVLRDFWADLGDPGNYDAETARRRRSVLTALVQGVSRDIDIDAHDLFWTTPARHKLWNPGRWSIEALKAADLEPLVAIKWAFNAKPDFLIQSPGHVLLVEAKVVSGKGTGDGYDQLDTQRLIGELLASHVPAFRGVTIHHATLGMGGDADLSWSVLADAVDVPGLDPFTRDGLRRVRALAR